MNVLMVAEKPIVAEEIAKILSNRKCSTRKEWNGCSVFEYTADFRGEPANFRVTSTFGHMMCVDFPKHYQRRFSGNCVDPAELFLCPIEQKETDPDTNMRDFLASEAKNCDILVLWLDCDKEGENICFEVMDAVRHAMNGPSGGVGFMKNVYRARFSAITEKEIKNAMTSLARPNIDESLAVDARQELDLRIGCAFTRFQNDYFKRKYRDLDSKLISFGPCQTPTLAFCVERHDEIVNFKPQPYWLLQAEVELPGGGGGMCRTLKLEWCRERQLNRGVAQTFLNKVKKCTEATVSDVSSKEHRKEKPDALNTVELLKGCSSSLGLSPSQTMAVAQYVYSKGYISYPRTETTAYPDSFDFDVALRELKNMPEFREFVYQLLSDGISKPEYGINKGDHPPITPKRVPPKRVPPKRVPAEFDKNCARVHEYIVQHFLATLMQPCKYLTKTVKFDIGGEQFQFQCRVVTDPGFTRVLNWLAVAQDQTMADNAPIVGQRIAIKKVDMIERMTAPPDYLTESELISLMEKYAIGTDGSIPTHINNICVRNYVKVEPNRRKLMPTTLGISLVHGYQRVDSDLILPTMRADVERQLDLIAKGKADYATMKNQTLEVFRQKFLYFVKNISSVDELFGVSFTTLADSGKPFSKCGKCRRYMKIMETGPQQLFCPICQDTYALPSSKGSAIRQHFERACPLDEFELLYYHVPGGKLSNSFPFCPYCFNHPTLEEMRGKQLGCNQCPQPDCPNLYKTQGVLPCMNQCFGGRGVLRGLELQMTARGRGGRGRGGGGRGRGDGRGRGRG
uniref:DNA topoisomerase n=1 Tax=Globodera rostochiensis TaxID=31243 RepID=A0A914GY25_GLORO